MKILFIFLLLLVNKDCSSQDSLLFKTKVDSILNGRRHQKVKVFKIRVDSLRVKYYFSKRTQNLELISIEGERQAKTIWIYNFHYIDGELSMLNKWNGTPARYKNGATSFYYLNKNKLVYREENNTQVDDIPYEINRAEEFKRKAPTY